MNVADHSDNLPLRLLELGTVAFAENEAFAERFAIGPELASQGLVDDGHASARAVVAIVERAAAQHRNAQDIEIAGRSGHPAASIVAAASGRSSHDVERNSEHGFERHDVRRGGPRYARQCFQALDAIADQIGYLRRTFEARAR